MCTALHASHPFCGCEATLAFFFEELFISHVSLWEFERWVTLYRRFHQKLIRWKFAPMDKIWRKGNMRLSWFDAFSRDLPKFLKISGADKDVLSSIYLCFDAILFHKEYRFFDIPRIVTTSQWNRNKFDNSSTWISIAWDRPKKVSAFLRRKLNKYTWACAPPTKKCTNFTGHLTREIFLHIFSKKHVSLLKCR